MRPAQELAAYIGLDWGDQRHAVQLQPAGGGGGGTARPRATAPRAARLGGPAPRTVWGPPARVGIAIEQRRGAVMHALMQYEFLVLYPVNPKALARYREAFHTSGAKDDPTDAALLLDLLRKHRDQLRPWHANTGTSL